MVWIRVMAKLRGKISVQKCYWSPRMLLCPSHIFTKYIHAQSVFTYQHWRDFCPESQYSNAGKRISQQGDNVCSMFTEQAEGSDLDPQKQWRRLRKKSSTGDSWPWLQQLHKRGSGEIHPDIKAELRMQSVWYRLRLKVTCTMYII